MCLTVTNNGGRTVDFIRSLHLRVATVFISYNKHIRIILANLTHQTWISQSSTACNNLKFVSFIKFAYFENLYIQL